MLIKEHEEVTELDENTTYVKTDKYNFTIEEVGKPDMMKLVRLLLNNKHITG